MNKDLDIQGQQTAWLEFVEHQKILPSVKPIVAISWKRWIGRLNPYKNSPLKCLSDKHLLAFQVTNFDLISIARPMMEDIHQFIEGSGTVITLANSAGYILDMYGDPETMEFVKQNGLMPGTLVSEIEIGTNAFGLSLTDRFPISVIGAEHFMRRFHELAEAAAPIFDLSGRPLGAIGLITPVRRYHPHMLGIAVAGARAIEGQLKSDYLLAEQNTQLAQLNAILETNSEGVLVWNADRVLMQINPAAAQILGIPESKVLGRHIGDFISYPEFIREAAERREPLTDVEVNLNIDGRSVSCVISMRYVIVKDKLQWIIITARQEKDVRRFVQSQVGAHASLTLADLPGESLQMKAIHRFIKTAALAEVSVLIQGESGTGKHPTASAIHNESPRRDGPFLIFPCSSVPSELVVQELLGFDKGLSDKMPGGRPSKFELAHGGTMYFQDVEALPLEAQGILLNVIDLGIVQRLGSKRPIEVDTRIIAATSANIEELINKENFRRGLFYRLRSLEIHLPPLRERKKDLPRLIDRILDRISKRLKRPLELDPGVVIMLNRYSWPGNIRELEAVINRAAAQAGFAGIIKTDHLPEYIRHPQPFIESSQDMEKVFTLSEMERDSIMRAAELCNGNVSAMARSLGISRTTMWRKLKKLDISPQEYRTTNSIGHRLN